MADKPSKLGSAETGIDTPDAIKAQGRQAEARAFLKHLLGIDVPEQLDDTESTRIATAVANRICTTVSDVRANLETEIRDELDARLKGALAVFSTPPTAAESADIVAEAVYKTIPPDLMNKFLRAEISPVVAAANIPANSLSLTCTVGTPPIARNVRINLNHKFWARNSYKDDTDLKAKMDGKSIADLGITVPPDGTNAALPSNYKLNSTEIADIVTKNMDAADVQNVPDTITKNVVDSAGNTVEVTIDARALLKSRDGTGALIASLDQAAFRTALADPTIWTGFVRVRPPVATPDVTIANNMGDEVYAELHGGTGPIALRSIGVLEAQREVRDQEVLLLRLQKGSQNAMGAALAAAMVSRDPSLRSSVTGGDRADIQKKLDTAQEEMALLDRIEQVGKEKMPTAEDSWQTVETKITDINAKIGSLAPSTTVTFGTESIVIGPDPKDVTEVRRQLNTRLSDLTKEQRAYRALASTLSGLATSIPTGKTCPGSLNAFFTSLTPPPPVPKPSEFRMGKDLATLASDWKKHLALKDKAEYEKDITKKREEIQKIDDGKAVGLQGDDAQRAVFKGYLENQGADERDAEQGAHYLSGRTLVDQEMEQGIDDTLHEMYGHIDEDASKGDKRYAIKVIAGIAKECGLDVDPVSYKFNPNTRNYEYLGGVDWQRGSYKQLVTAYFALRRVLEGEAGSLKIKNTDFVSEQMMEIGKILATRYVHQLEKDFGGNLSDEDKEKLKNKKLSYQQVIELMLSGLPPEKYKGKIDKALHGAEDKMKWKKMGAFGRFTKNLAWNWTTWPALKYGVGYGIGVGVGKYGIGYGVGTPLKYLVGKPVQYVVNNPGRAALLVGLTLATGFGGLLLYKAGESVGNAGAGGGSGGHGNSH